MKTKENVYGRTAGAEDAATAGGKEEEALTALGKFKDVNALARAYESLQAEFTRRSQRLKELDRAVENSSEKVEKAHSAGAMAEKLRRKADGAREEERAFDSFVSELETASVRAEKTEDEEPVVASPETDASISQAKTGESADGQGEFVANGREEVGLSSDQIYSLAMGDERVRLKIVGEYLSSVGKSGAPMLKGGAGGLVTPPLRAKTVAEAGSMALRFLRSKGEK